MHRYVNLKEIGEQKLVGGILPRLTRRQQQQTVPNNLRASLRSHGHGMSLVNVNAEQSHANDITPDYHEHILQQFGLFTNGLSTRVALNAQEKKAEERHRKQVLGFAFRVICNTQLLFAIVSYIAVTAVIVHVQAIRGRVHSSNGSLHHIVGWPSSPRLLGLYWYSEHKYVTIDGGRDGVCGGR